MTSKSIEDLEKKIEEYELIFLCTDDKEEKNRYCNLIRTTQHTLIALLKYKLKEENK